MGRSSVAGNPQQAATQKILLYVSPLFLGIFGLRISVGGLLYWFTSNVWSMVQQLVVIRRMPPIVEAGSGPPAPPADATKPSRTGGRLAGRKHEPTPPAPTPARLVQQRTAPDGPPAQPGAPPRGGRPPRGGTASKRKKGRKGGRR